RRKAEERVREEAGRGREGRGGQGRLAATRTRLADDAYEGGAERAQQRDPDEAHLRGELKVVVVSEVQMRAWAEQRIDDGAPVIGRIHHRVGAQPDTQERVLP